MVGVGKRRRKFMRQCKEEGAGSNVYPGAPQRSCWRRRLPRLGPPKDGRKGTFFLSRTQDRSVSPDAALQRLDRTTCPWRQEKACRPLNVEGVFPWCSRSLSGIGRVEPGTCCMSRPVKLSGGDMDPGCYRQSFLGHAFPRRCAATKEVSPPTWIVVSPRRFAPG